MHEFFTLSHVSLEFPAKIIDDPLTISRLLTGDK